MRDEMSLGGCCKQTGWDAQISMGCHSGLETLSAGNSMQSIIVLSEASVNAGIYSEALRLSLVGGTATVLDRMQV